MAGDLSLEEMEAFLELDDTVEKDAGRVRRTVSYVYSTKKEMCEMSEK